MSYVSWSDKLGNHDILDGTRVRVSCVCKCRPIERVFILIVKVHVVFTGY